MGEENILLPGLEGFVYKGPTYLELNKKLKSNPLVYNLIQQNIARRNNPTKEIVSYKDANGNTLHTTNVAAGVLSPVDPLAELYVTGKVLDPVFKYIGNIGYMKSMKKYGLDRLEWRGLKGKGSYIELKPLGEWMLPVFMQSTKSGIGKKLYDAAIKYALSKGYKGIISGENLLSAPKTYSIWKHYPNKILIGNNGSHTNVNMYGKRGVFGYKKVNSSEELIQATLNGEKAVLENGNIYGLNHFNKNIFIKKQGGKMNVLQFLKNGSGIHIKKKNRGKFTDYCGGKVTSECIAKGKRSSNPAIRKRATFAANARKWKHEDGGRVKKHLAFVNGVSVLDSNPDAYKYVKKKIKKAADGGNSKNWFSGVGNWLNKNLNTISTIGSAITNGVGLIKQNSELSKAKAAKEKELDAKYNPNNLIDDSEIWNEVNNQISLLELLNPDVHYGEVDKLNLYNKVRNQYLSQAKQYALFVKTWEQQWYNLYISDAQAGNTSSLMNLIGNGISTGIGMLGNKSTTSTSSVPTGTTTTSYSSYAPGYTPSLPKTFSEYAALNYKK